MLRRLPTPGYELRRWKWAAVVLLTLPGVRVPVIGSRLCERRWWELEEELQRPSRQKSFFRMGLRVGMHAAMMPSVVSTWDQKGMNAHCLFEVSRWLWYPLDYRRQRRGL